MKLLRSMRALFSRRGHPRHTDREGIHEEIPAFSLHLFLRKKKQKRERRKKISLLIFQSDSFKSICVCHLRRRTAPHLHRHSEGHTKITGANSLKVISGKSTIYMDHYCADWSANSSEWLRSLAENYSPLIPTSFPHCCGTYVCVCSRVCGEPLWGPREPWRRFLFPSCSLRIDNTLCCAWDRNQKALRRRPKIYLSPLNVKSLQHIVRTRPTALWGLQTSAFSFLCATYQ